MQDATTHEALFVQFELPADFLEDLAKFEEADDAQNAGQAGQVGGTANLADLSAQGMSKRKQLQAMVRNKFKGNPGILAKWETARHVERPSRAKKPATPQP